MNLLGTLAAIWAVSFAYIVYIHWVAARERASRRKGGPVRLTVRVWPPAPAGDSWPGDEVARLKRGFLGIVSDRPIVLPFVAAIIAGGGTLVLMIDLMMEQPFVWSEAAARGVQSMLPGPARIALALVVVAGVIANAVWIFLAAHLTLGWEKLSLEPGGRIALAGAEMPVIDPNRAVLTALSIPSAHGAPADGVTLEQDGLCFAFDYLGQPAHGNGLRPAPAVPHDWWHIVIEGEPERLDAFVKAHYAPAML